MRGVLSRVASALRSKYYANKQKQQQKNSNKLTADIPALIDHFHSGGVSILNKQKQPKKVCVVLPRK
jgi:hypothetical protein